MFFHLFKDQMFMYFHTFGYNSQAILFVHHFAADM